jgi:hypothetical protein
VISVISVHEQNLGRLKPRACRVVSLLQTSSTKSYGTSLFDGTSLFVEFGFS